MAKKISGMPPVGGSGLSGMGPTGPVGAAVAGSQHPNRNHAPMNMGNTSSFDMGRKVTAASRHGSSKVAHGPGPIKNRKGHAAGEGC